MSTDPSIQDFESAIAELETIVKTLEDGDLALERSLALFERGVQLSRFCHARLEAAERRIEILNERGEVQPAPASLGLDPRRRRIAVSALPPLDAWLSARRDDVEAALDRFLASPTERRRAVTAAMRYSLLAGGKRLRPMLALAASEACGTQLGLDAERGARAGAAGRLRDRVDPHLLADPRRPAVDGQRQLRRGRPTSHIVHGEALAILAGDALLTEAFTLLAREQAVEGVDRRALVERQLRAVRHPGRSRGRHRHGRRPGARSPGRGTGRAAFDGTSLAPCTRARRAR